MGYELLIQNVGFPEMKLIAESCRVSLFFPGFMEILIEGEISHINSAFIISIKEIE